MCPVCLANVALIAAGVASTGLTTFAVSKIFKKKESEIRGIQNEPAKDGNRN
jgi:hypothetical protein